MTGASLRAAAALMRERAEAAMAGPWVVDRFFWKVGSTRGLADSWWQEVTNGGDTVCQIQEGDAADGKDPDLVHIASWHPSVALVVADWLDAQAALIERCGDFFDTEDSTDSAALAVAAAYLGTDA